MQCLRVKAVSAPCREPFEWNSLEPASTFPWHAPSQEKIICMHGGRAHTCVLQGLGPCRLSSGFIVAPGRKALTLHFCQPFLLLAHLCASQWLLGFAALQLGARFVHRSSRRARKRVAITGAAGFMQVCTLNAARLGLASELLGETSFPNIPPQDSSYC